MRRILTFILAIGIVLVYSCSEDKKSNPVDNTGESNFEFPYTADQFVGNWELQFDVYNYQLVITKVNDSTLHIQNLDGKFFNTGDYSMKAETLATSSRINYFLDYRNKDDQYNKLRIDTLTNDGFEGEYTSNIHDIWNSYKLIKK